MKLIKSVLAALFLIVFFQSYAVGDDIRWRSADPCEKWRDWQEGEDHLIILALREGLASHALSPAQIIFLSARENKINPILLLAILEEQQGLVSLGAEETDYFESRHFYVLRFDVIDGKSRYGGFFPQLVAATFELRLFWKRGWKLSAVYSEYFQGGNFEKFRLLYDAYAKQISRLAGVKYKGYLDTPETYLDYRGQRITAEIIQLFLEERNSPLKDKKLFRRPPIDNSIDYGNPPCVD